MSNFRTTADLLDGVLRRCGEMTSDQGTSSLQTAALLYLNQLHQTIICGGNELEVDVDESWIWARSRRPTILQLNPAITTGSITLTNGSTAGTFSTAPQLNSANVSVEGWYLKPDGAPEIYRIISHTSGQTGFQLDAAFPQTSYASTFSCFQLEYDLIPSYLNIDSYNDKLDFISRGTVSQTATMTHGSYTPSALATHAAAVLTAQDTNLNTYSGSYDTVSRNFTMTSGLGGTATAIFTISGSGTSSARSGWPILGFDCLAQTGSASYSSAYPVGATARLTEPARVYYTYGAGGKQPSLIANVDQNRFDKEFLLGDVRQGVPEHFTVTGEHSQDGRMSVRFDKYPSQAMRVEFETVPYPRDLQNNTASIPKIPKKWARVLEYGASYYLMLDKSNDKAQAYLVLAQQLLKGMLKANRQELLKTGQNFGGVIARPDLMPTKNRILTYGYDKGEY